MNKALAEFLVANGRPKKTKNYPELNGFLYAVACSPEVVDAQLWLPLVFDNKKIKYKNNEERKSITQGLLDEFSAIEGRIKNQSSVLADYFRPSDELLENFDEDSPIAHWGVGFAEGHEWLEEVWAMYFPEQKKNELLACVNFLSFFSDKEKASRLCEAQGIEGLALDVYAESVLENFDAAAHGYAHFGISIRAAIDEQKIRENKLVLR